MNWALGAQYREDELERELPNAQSDVTRAPCADSLLNPAAACLIPNGVFGFVGPQREFEIDSDVYGVFGELGLPITDSLQAQLAFRYEDYGDRTGSTSNPKLALRWQATDWLALRGSASSTFRGPVLLQLQPNPLTSLQFVPQFATVATRRQLRQSQPEAGRGGQLQCRRIDLAPDRSPRRSTTSISGCKAR